LQVIKEAELTLPVHLEAIDFTDEEGTLVGLLGSAAIAGKISQHDLENPRGGRQALLEGLGRAGLSESGILSARRDPQTLAGYLELHIEQGPRLVKAGVDIGVVTAIVGIVSTQLRTSAMQTIPALPRSRTGWTPAWAPCSFARRHRIVQAGFPVVATVGRCNSMAFNSVPARCRFS
jgi:hypothetical protein